MRIAVTGSSGLIGSALIAMLTGQGHTVLRIVRSGPPGPPAAGASGPGSVSRVPWDPAAGTFDPAGLRGVDAAVHLAGENVGAGFWTAGRKARILNSRAQGTRLLCETLARLSPPPRVLISASATGYYGDRGEEILTESSAAGRGFLAEVARVWEESADPARAAGVRVVHPRMGVVLTSKGGALPRMLLPFRLGLGARLGNGRQYFPWISLEDLLGAVSFALDNDTVQGPVNAVAPQMVTNGEFSRTLAHVLSRPLLFGVPALALRTGLGEMGQEMLLASQRVQPARLLAGGFAYRWPDLEGALRQILGRPGGGE